MKSGHIMNTAAAVFIALLSQQTFAGDNVTINITGKVIASPCTTINGGAATLSVPLGDDIQATTLSSAASGTTPVKFEIPLTGCPLGTTNIKATFAGTADSDNTLWKNTAATPAANTAVELTNQADSAKISNGSTLDAAVSSGSATYKLQARAYSTLGSVTPGDIESTIVVSFEYQ